MTEAELTAALNVSSLDGLKSIVDYAKGLRDGRSNRIPPLPDQGPRYDEGYADGQKIRMLPAQADGAPGAGPVEPPPGEPVQPPDQPAQPPA